jgi:hypothetical protein
MGLDYGLAIIMVATNLKGIPGKAVPPAGCMPVLMLGTSCLLKKRSEHRQLRSAVCRPQLLNG